MEKFVVVAKELAEMHFSARQNLPSEPGQKQRTSFEINISLRFSIRDRRRSPVERP